MARSIAIAFLSLMIAVPGSAQASNEPKKVASSQDAETDKNRSDRVICKTTEELGTRLKRNRICRTAAEWNTERQENRAMLQRMQTNKYCGGDGC
jgi:hypothetical protein